MTNRQFAVGTVVWWLVVLVVGLAIRAFCQTQAEAPYPNGPNIWLVRSVGYIQVYKFQDGPNDCYITHNSKTGGYNGETVAMACVKR